MGKSKIIKLFVFMLLLVGKSYGESLCDQLGTLLQGETSRHDRVCDVFVPRNDLISVLGGFTLHPEMGIGLEAEFIPIKGSRQERLVQAEIALLESEVQAVELYLIMNNFEITALHNHTLFDTPKVMYLHFSKTGNAIQIATQLRELLNAVGNFSVFGESTVPVSFLDPATLNQILGLNGELKAGGIYRADFQRPFHVRDSGTTSEPEGMIAIQGTGASAILLGEMPLRVSEVETFIQTLLANNIIVSAIHNHEISERPRLIYVHFQQIGPPDVLAAAVRQALNTAPVE
ncbi:DUF1259 domain-containing protein [Candidatus Protochlamydia phocaeensis]|uniref:DUF1259 domain-containing protein n=1 Tax=Candidatus Protochlamydia phocaeensis TaxID=1414722 RepID=UPI0008385F87|nr:DUF1259 domain-containing protein [Candidatus Protochlamydia phocaeensis]